MLQISLLFQAWAIPGTGSIVPDLKGFELLCRLFLSNFHIADPGVGRALMAEPDHLLDGVPISLKDRLHLAIREISHPSPDSKFLCHFLGRGAKEYPLDVSAHPDVYPNAAHLHSVPMPGRIQIAGSECFEILFVLVTTNTFLIYSITLSYNFNTDSSDVYWGLVLRGTAMAGHWEQLSHTSFSHARPCHDPHPPFPFSSYVPLFPSR